MAAWRYEIFLLVLKTYFTQYFNISTLEEKFRISARPCNILYIFPKESKSFHYGVTVKPRFMGNRLIRTPCYYGHFLWSPQCSY